MATKTDLKTQLITTFNDVVAASGSSGNAGSNLKETINGDSKMYQVFVNSETSSTQRNGLGGRDYITIIDDGITTTNRYTIRMVTSASKQENIILETSILSADFDAMETSFLAILEAYRADIYQNSINIVNAVGTSMINRLF